jgi:hypothetical protein
VTVKDREKTFASNLATGYRTVPGPSGLVEAAANEGDQGLLNTHEGAPEGFGATYWFPGGLLAEGCIRRGTTSIQLTPPLTPKPYLDEASMAAVLALGHHVTTCLRPLGSELGWAPGTGDVSVTLGKTAALWAGGLGNLFTYFSSLAETSELRAPAQPHQEAVEWIKTATGLSWERVGRLVGVTRQAVNAWKQGRPIADDHRRRLFEVRDVLERAAKRNPEPGGLAAWLDTPRGADARTPANLLEAGEVAKARLLALSSPSRGVKAPPEWARRGAREAYLNSRERVRALPPERDEQLAAEASEDGDE